MPRLFTGLELPGDVAQHLEFMRGGIPGARWIDKDNYHITLRFAGDMPDEQANDLAGALERAGCEPFEVRFAGLGWFGGTRPHSLHVKVEETDELCRLQSMHERICQTIGLAPEARKFCPHVTIARLKGASTGAVSAFVSRHNLYQNTAFEVSRFVLFSARPGRGGGPYRVEAAYDLATAM